MVTDEKVVIYGQSCAGKTTFAKQCFPEHHYYCFDALFLWKEIETLGLSISKNLEYIQRFCNKEKFVLDGWYLSDLQGQFLPEDAIVYVLWCSYDKMIKQYRGTVVSYDSMIPMYKKWYCEFDYRNLKNVKFFNNSDSFEEISYNDFITLSKYSL